MNLGMLFGTRRTSRISFGPSRHQVGILRPPESTPPGVPPNPTVVLVHGGFWTWPYNRWSMLLLERNLAERGWGTFNTNYRRLGRFGGGGGWPNTFDDVRSAIETATEHETTTGPVIVVGHSAGGHLGLVASATVSQTPDLVVAMAAPTDLERVWNSGSEPVDDLTSGAPAAQRWELTSPRHMLPLGLPIVCVHGTDDTTVDGTTAALFVEIAQAAGDDAEFVNIPGDAHRDALVPTSGTWAAVVSAISEHLAAHV